MSKYYLIQDPFVDTIMSVKEIVRERVLYGERFYRGYCTAEDALLDFIVVNWAVPCNRKGVVVESK